MMRAARGQIVLEYFIIFAVVAALTLVALTTFDDDVRTSLEHFFTAAADKMAGDGP